LLLYKRRPDEAESVLLQAKLFYRAIRLNIRLFRWQRALDLALQYKMYVDLVLGFRQKYLKSIGQPESDKRFTQPNTEVQVDWTAIQAKIAQEHESEFERAMPFGA